MGNDSIVMLRNKDTGEMMMFMIPANYAADPSGYLQTNAGLEGWEPVPFESSVGTVMVVTPNDPAFKDIRAEMVAEVGNSQKRIQGAQRQEQGRNQAATDRQTQVAAAGSNRGLYQQATGAPQQSLQRPMGGDLIAGLDPTGRPLTNSQIIGANQKTRQAAIDAGLPTTDQFDRQITDPTVTMMGLPQMNQANKYTPGVNTNPAQSRPLNDGSNGLGGPSYNPSNPAAGTPAATGDQPYSMNDDVALQTLLNNGAGNDMLAENYIRQGGYGNSVHSDFARKNFEVYDDLYAMQNPGAPVLGANDMYGKQTQYMQEMSQPVGDGVGMLNGGQLWDNQFSPEYMGSERAQGTGEDFEARSKSQYDQIMTNVVALQPSMGPSGISAIMNMVDQSFEDYKYLSMSGDPTVQNMSFVQYLQSIGAEEWF